MFDKASPTLATTLPAVKIMRSFTGEQERRNRHQKRFRRQAAQFIPSSAAARSCNALDLLRLKVEQQGHDDADAQEHKLIGW